MIHLFTTQVGDLTGIALPAMFERSNSHEMSSIQKKAFEIFGKETIGRNRDEKKLNSTDMKFLETCRKDYSGDDIKGFTMPTILVAISIFFY